MNKILFLLNKCLSIILFACLMNVQVINAAENQIIKIISWNVLDGFNEHKYIEEASQWLNIQTPNVIALQELRGISEKQLGDYAKKWGHLYAATNKETGYPVGLTSKEPIEVIERRVKGYHHGFLHCKTYGIHFFVVHFWPHEYKQVDDLLNTIKPLLKQKQKVVIMGDFNNCSRKDEAFLISHAKLRKRDYAFVDNVEALGFVDIVHKHDPSATISCPSPVTIPKWSKNMEELKLKQYRIDFIFADKLLAQTSVYGTIIFKKELDNFSDHYPVIVKFDLSKPDKLSKNK